MGDNPANRKAPEIAPVLDEQWTPGAAQSRRQLPGAPDARPAAGARAAPSDLFAGMFRSTKLGNFDMVYDPDNIEQIMAGQLTTRDNRAVLRHLGQFPAKSMRKNPVAPARDPVVGDYRIDATVTPDFTLNVVTRVKAQE